MLFRTKIEMKKSTIIPRTLKKFKNLLVLSKAREGKECP